MKGSLPMSAISWICAIVFIGIGLYALKRTTPMHFWAGTTVRPEEILDVKAYNQANGVMWIAYGALYVLAGIVSFYFGAKAGGIVISLACLPGLFGLLLAYYLIRRKYGVKQN